MPGADSPNPSRRAGGVILLPPSEGKASGGHGPPWARARTSFPELAADRAAVRDAVRATLGDGDAAASRLLGVRGDHLRRAQAEWEALDDAPTTPASARYAGVVWGALDPEGLSPAARRRLRARVLIPSGLWGVSAAGDQIPAYRLRMGARVRPLGALAAYWRPRITPLVAARAAGGWVIDLLPAEHAAALDTGALAGRTVRVEIVEDGPGGRRAVGHGGKAVKGRLARALLEADARGPEGLERLEVAGLILDDSVRGGPGEPARVVFRRTDG
jgi:uncharacterized protein